MGDMTSWRARPRIFNTAFESGLRSLVLLTACYPNRLGLRRLVVLDHLLVHTADIGGPESLHPQEESRNAELLVRRKLIDSGLSLMGTRRLIVRHATADGFRYEAGEEAGSFVDLLRESYTAKLKERAAWLNEHIVPLDDDEIDDLVRLQMDRWSAEFQSDRGVTN